MVYDIHEVLNNSCFTFNPSSSIKFPTHQDIFMGEYLRLERLRKTNTTCLVTKCSYIYIIIGRV